MLFEYIPVFYFICCAFVLSFILLCLSFITGGDFSESEKLSAYECGFNPFEDSRKTFDIKFYVIAMVFIVFDVEVALLIPLVFTSFSLATEGIATIFVFVLILIIGFIYEWIKEILNWA